MIEKLLEYQSVDKNLKDIENQLKKSNEFKMYAQAVKFLKGVKESKVQMESKAGSLLATLNSIEAKITELDEQKAEFVDIDKIEEEDTVNFLKKKTQELQKQYSSLEAEMENLKKDMKSLWDEYQKMMEDAKKMLDQQNEYKDKYEALAAEKEAEKKPIMDKLDKIAKDIPEKYLEMYKEKRKDPKFPIVYEIQGKHCPSCSTELSQLELSRLKKEKLIECENCRKLLFIKE